MRCFRWLSYMYTLYDVQGRGRRFVEGDHQREPSVTQMVIDLGWQSLEVRRVFNCPTLVFEIVQDLVDVETQILVKSGCAIRQSTGQHHYRSSYELF